MNLVARFSVSVIVCSDPFSSEPSFALGRGPVRLMPQDGDDDGECNRPVHNARNCADAHYSRSPQTIRVDSSLATDIEHCTNYGDLAHRPTDEKYYQKRWGHSGLRIHTRMVKLASMAGCTGPYHPKAKRDGGDLVSDDEWQNVRSTHCSSDVGRTVSYQAKANEHVDRDARRL